MTKACDIHLAYKCLEYGAADYIISPVKTTVCDKIWTSLWRKKREHKMLQLLSSEREELAKKDKILNDLVSKTIIMKISLIRILIF